MRAFIFVAFVLLTVMPFASAAAAPATAPAGSDKLREQLAKNLPELSFDAVPFADVMDFLRDVTGANIHVDWRSLAAAGIERTKPATARLRDIRFSKALDLILADAGAGKAVYIAAGDVIWIVAKKDAATKAARLKRAKERPVNDPAVKAKLDKRVPEVRFHEVGFSDTIEFLRDITGANIFVNWAALEEQGVKRDTKVEVRLKEVRFGEALDILLDSLPGEQAIDFTVDQGVIEIKPVTPTT